MNRSPTPQALPKPEPRKLALLRRTFEGVLGVPFTDGNRIEVLRNGARIFPAMLEAIAAARERIEFLTFVYWTGDIADRFAKALAERARAGVNVDVLLDAFGAHAMSRELIEEMREAGVEVRWFRPPSRWKIWQLDNRTHRKILVCDRKVGFTGGVGIAAEWEGDARDENEWRETHFRIEGPAVDGLRAAFLGNWAETGARPHTPGEPFPEHERKGLSLVQVIRTSAAVEWSDAAQVIRLASSVAESRLRITTAYFVPDDRARDLLIEACARGVEVTVMLPGEHCDQRLAQLGGEDQFQPLLEAGVRIEVFQPTMLHAKIITVDGALAITGSTNYNHRSMGKDDEVIVTIIDPEVVARLEADFDEDLGRCSPIDLESWNERGIVQRTLETLARGLKQEL